MRVCVTRRVILLGFLILPAFATAQQPETSETPEPISSPLPGSAIAVPLPAARLREMRRYEIPELAGAEVAYGSYLVEGRLPRPIADYSASVAEIRQRISIFENGIVSISMSGAGGTIRKRILIPPDALEQYRKGLAAEALDEFAQEPLSSTPTADRALLRIYREDGSVVERTFNPTLVQAATIEKPLGILNDLLRALSEDREATNPLTGYVPKVGDQLVSDDQQSFRVVRVLQEGKYVELVSTREPLTLYVATKDLNSYFIGKRRSTKRDE